MAGMNEGEMAEAVCGAAIIAKLVARKAGGKISKVGVNEVKKILREMQKAPAMHNMAGKKSQYVQKTQIKLDVGGSAKDRITFMLVMKGPALEYLQSMKDLKSLDKLCQSAASYANAPRTEALAESVYNNNTNNQITVDVDGVTNNYGSKTDVKVLVDGNVFDKLSLKYASSESKRLSLGQVGGNSWNTILRVLGDGYNEITRYEKSGLQLKIGSGTNEKKYMHLVGEDPTYETLANAIGFAYRLADDLFNAMSQETLAKNITSFVKFHSTMHDMSVRLVEFHSGTHTVFNPLVLEDNLKKIKLKSITRFEGKWPLFLIYDASVGGPPTSLSSANVIFQLRPKADPRRLYVSHIVEKGLRLNQLMDVTGKE